MKLSKLFAPLAAAALALTSLAGCAGEVSGGVIIGPDPVPAPGAGTLTVFWTIDGTEDPFACIDLGIDAMELIVYRRAGPPFTTVNAPCEDFGLTVELPEGAYDAEATLVDRFGGTASDTLMLEDLVIVDGTDLTSDIDFPLGSIR